jgi:hypothetical protein
MAPAPRGEAAAPPRGRVRARALATLASALLLFAAGHAAYAQKKKDPPRIPHSKSQLKTKDKEPAAEPAQAKPRLPPPEQMAMMIQTSVVALSQANLTGNFTVLHALGAPSFQKANTPAKLFEIFKDLRDRNIDLTPVILFSPVLLREPAINEQGMLHLVGYYKTSPQQVHFELLFQPVGGQWRLFGISVRTQPASQPAAAANQPAANADKAKNTK